jgi:CubicO group peptidase (beta-lactamase class C family)
VKPLVVTSRLYGRQKNISADKNLMTMKKILYIIPFLVLSSCDNKTSQDNFPVQTFDSICNSLQMAGTFNGNILVAEKGNVVYKGCFGIANEQTGQKLNENSIFELASLSKQFTAMAIVLLKEKDKLSLDDKMSKFIPELIQYNDVSIRNLLNHTGGLPDYMELMDSMFDKSKIATNQDIIALFVKHKPKVLFTSNTKFEYSNTGYALLATIIENVSGKSYSEFLEENIFKPLDMKNTFVYTRRKAPKKIDNYAYGYIYSDSLKRKIIPDSLNETKFVVYLDGIVGDGTVNSTVIDLLKWDRALYSTELCSRSSIKEIFTPGVLDNKTYTNYGFGWFLVDGGRIANHTGGWPGYTMFIERDLENDETIIILQNMDEVRSSMRTLRTMLVLNK